MMKKIALLFLLLAFAAVVAAQDATSTTATAQQSPDPQQQQEEKAKQEKKAIALLEQVVTDSQGLRLPENKIRVQIAAGDMLWEKNPARARGLLNDAGAMLGQMILDVDRTDRGEVQSLNQIRQELVLTAGRHDAELGYQLLRSTQQQPAPAAAAAGNPRQGRQFVFDQGNNLEQSLLATIAANDPKVAYQKTIESLDKGEFPTALNRVLSQLQTKDPELFKKLADKTLTRLSSDSLLASREATGVAMNLLLPGPRVTNTAATAQPAAANPAGTTQNIRGGSPVLSETAYHDLMDQTISAALSATSAGQTGNPQRGGGAARVMRGPGQQPQQPQTPPDDAQVRQNNARTLLFSLQGMLPQIDQYNPDRAAAVRQKLTDLGVNNNNAMNFVNQMRTATQQGTSDSLMTAAGAAPPQAQSFFYQQAAQKAIDEGNTDRAMQIANDHLNEAQKNTIMQAIDFKRLTTTASAEKLNEIKQKLAALPSDSDRVKYLIDLAAATQKDNPKLALRFLDDANALVAKRAMNYKDFEDQIKVAHAYATVDAKRSFQILDAGIAELNELLAAATVLNGFEVDIFKDGEMSSRSDSDLVGMVVRFSGELGSLSKVDFDGAHLTADKFQLPEARMTARLSIVQSVMGTQPVGNVNRRGQGQNFQFFSR
jgi:ribosomal protein L20